MDGTRPNFASAPPSQSCRPGPPSCRCPSSSQTVASYPCQVANVGVGFGIGGRWARSFTGPGAMRRPARLATLPTDRVELAGLKSVAAVKNKIS